MPPLMLLRMIWGMLLTSQGAFVFLASIQSRPEGLAPLDPVFATTISVAAVIAFVTSFVLPRFLFRAGLRRNRPRHRDDLVRMYFVPAILQFALLDAVTLMGFVVSMTAHENRVLPFAGAAILGFFFAFPTESKIENMARFE